MYILRYNILRNVDLDTLNKRAANYLRVLIFAILLSFAEIAEINTRKNMSLLDDVLKSIGQPVLTKYRGLYIAIAHGLFPKIKNYGLF